MGESVDGLAFGHISFGVARTEDKLVSFIYQATKARKTLGTLRVKRGVEQKSEVLLTVRRPSLVVHLWQKGVR